MGVYGKPSHRERPELLVARAKKMRREQTPAEWKLWKELRDLKPQGFHFRRQVVFEPYIVDFCCHKTKLIIELDGETHDSVKAQNYDKRRDAYLTSKGYHVVRFDNGAPYESPDGVIDAIFAARRANPHP